MRFNSVISGKAYSVKGGAHKFVSYFVITFHGLGYTGGILSKFKKRGV